MRVTVAQLSDSVPEDEWSHLVAHVGDWATELVLLGEMPFDRWLPATDEVDKWALREALVSKFSLEDLQELCYFVEQALEQDGVEVMGRPLQVNLEILGGSGKRAKVLNLIQYLDRRGYLGYLVAAMRQLRPGSI